MGVAATAIAHLLHKHRWIGYVGLAIVFYVAMHMIWEGHRSVVIDLNKVDSYNAVAPSFLDITNEEVIKERSH
jgi:predicted tellurium resistance membrane protein TerC